MRTKFVGLSALLTLFFVALWLVFLVIEMLQTGAGRSPGEVYTDSTFLTPFFFLTNILALFSILVVSIFYTALSRYCQGYSPLLAEIGFIFVPIFAAIAILVHFSQIAVVPGLVNLSQQPEYRTAAIVFLQQLIQTLPGSGAFYLSGLAYALLGIPSITLGIVLITSNSLSRWSGLFLGLSGCAWILALVGSPLYNWWLSGGSIIGGLLFLCAMVPLVLRSWIRV